MVRATWGWVTVIASLFRIRVLFSSDTTEVRRKRRANANPAKLFQNGLHHWETSIDYSKDSFQAGQKSNFPGLNLRILLIDVRGDFDSIESEHADPVYCFNTGMPKFPHVLRILSNERGGKAYIMPIENIPLVAIFLPVGRWRPHSTGIGKTTVVTSRARLKAPMKRSKDFSFPQPPLTRGFQLRGNGRHIKHPPTATAIK